MDYEAYAALPGIRASRLRKMAKSGAHYKYEPDNDTADRGKLRAIHQLVIEGPETMARDFVVYEGKRDLRIDKYRAFLAAHPGKSVLNQNEVAETLMTALSYLNRPDPVTGRLLGSPRSAALIREAAAREETIQWTHPATGLACKARLDLRNGLEVSDLKTYGTTQPHQIRSRAASLFAHLQAAHYVEGTALKLGVPEREIRYRLLVAEGRAPWDVAVCELVQDGALRVGRELRKRLMDRIAECEASKEWPGACPGEQELEVPEWADPEDDEFTTDAQE